MAPAPPRILVVDPAPPSRDFLLRELRAAGYHVTGLTPLEASPSLAECDEALIAPFVPFEECLAAVRDLDEQRPLQGVVAYHQAAVTTGNRLAHALGVEPAWGGSERDLGDKSELYELWAEAGVPHPPTTIVTGPEDPRIASARYPVVIKPSSMQGGIGTRRCETTEQAVSKPTVRLHVRDLALG